MKGHRIRLERIHHIHHILALRVIAGIAAMPCIPAIQQQRIRAFAADCVDHCGNPIQPAHATIGLRERRKIRRAKRIGRGAAILDTV